jgi:hypothetical protein
MEFNVMPYREETFYYTTGWSDALTAAGQAVNQQINIASDANFKAYYYTVAVRQGAAGSEVLIANFAGDVQINDTQVGKSLFNIAAPLNAISGIGELPYNLAPPRVFASNTVIVFVTTTNVATRTQVNFTLHGAKLFQIGV